MKCPVCGEAMKAVEGRGDVELDCCPKCKGIWLDRGELDGLMAAEGHHDESLHLRHCGRYPGRRELIRELLHIE